MVSTPRRGEGLDLERFACELIGGLAHEMEAVMGRREAREIVRLVGLGMGDDLARAAAPDLMGPGGPRTPEDFAAVCVALKRQIGGRFSVDSVAPGAVVFTNTRCPFGEDVAGRPSLCMMTSSVFGGIAARRFGDARVDVERAIARGDPGCRVVVRWGRIDARPTEWSETYRGNERSDP